MPVSEIIKKAIVKVDIEDPISRVLGKFAKKNDAAVLVYQKNQYVGIVDKRKFIRLRNDITKMKVRRVTTKVPKLNLGTNFKEAARLLLTADTHFLPVVKHNLVQGVVHIHDVLAKLKIPHVKVSEIIKKPIILNEKDPISKALNILKQKHISRIPVVDNAGKLVGILTETDLLAHYFSFPAWKPGGAGKPGMKSHPAKERNTTKLPVKNEITTPVFTVTEDNTIKQATEIMANEKIASVIVVDGEIPVGLVTIKDIFRIVTT